jgi:hypothetical protein
MMSNVPQWLDAKFFEKVLRTSSGDKNLTVRNLNNFFAGDRLVDNGNSLDVLR